MVRSAPSAKPTAPRRRPSSSAITNTGGPLLTWRSARRPFLSRGTAPAAAAAGGERSRPACQTRLMHRPFGGRYVGRRDRSRRRRRRRHRSGAVLARSAARETHGRRRYRRNPAAPAGRHQARRQRPTPKLHAANHGRRAESIHPGAAAAACRTPAAQRRLSIVQRAKTSCCVDAPSR